MKLWKGLVTAAVAVAAGLVVPTPAMAATLEGIDISAYQPTVNWTSVKNAGKSFAIIKATESNTYTSSTFASQYAGAKSVGIIRGPYHFARPDTSSGDAVREADYFWNAIKSVYGPGDLPPALDLEANAGLSSTQMVNWVKAWLDEMELKSGRIPIIYVSPGNWQGWLANSTAFTRYPLWVAHYYVSSPIIPGGWSKYTFWQYSPKGSVSGISGGVDVDHFNGTLADLQALAQGAPPGPCDPVQINRTSYPALQSGSTDKAAVCAAESLLKEAGQTLTVDGTYDNATTTAVSAFQTANSVYGGATGAIDQWTWTALLAHGSSYPTIQSGSSGEAVARLQRALTAALGTPIDQDGVIGPKTVTAIKSYQSQYAPPADGIVGSGTWGHLRKGR